MFAQIDVFAQGVQVTWLNLGQNEIADASALARLKFLTTLVLNDNHLSKLDMLQGAESLGEPD